MRFLENLDQINPKIVYVIMAIVLAIPIIKPIGMPLTINEDLTLPVYNWIESLDPDDLVVFDASYSGGSSSELSPQLQAWFYHCMRKGIKVVGVSQWPVTGPLATAAIDSAVAQCERDGISAEYGVDWAFVGYKAGEVVTWRAMQDDFWRACANTDYFQNDFSTLPLMDRIPRWTNEYVDGIFCLAGGTPGSETYTMYFADQPLYLGEVAVGIASSLSTLRAGLAKGVVPGLRGAAEYEKLLDKPGYATKLMDAQSMGHLTIIVLVILGNISFAMKKRRMSRTPI